MMKKYPGIFLLMVAACIFFLSCQREWLFDTLPSAGSLQGSSGNCLPKNISGTYIAATNTGDTNFIEVFVHVTRAGAYTVITDTVNGYFFNSSGNFSDTGMHMVKLPAAGTPVMAGIDNFTVSYDSSSCLVSVAVSTLISGVSPAVYTLQGAPDTCLPFDISGNYIPGITLTAEDTLTVTLNVAVAGSYTIATNTVNGYQFTGSGVVNTGLQKITLKGTGTPINSGTDIFTVAAGNSACTFSITITNPVTVSGTDYFPLTTNSYWTYDDLVNIGDTVKRVITDSVVNSGNLYHIMHEYDRYGGDTAFMFERTGNNYIQYGPVDILTLALKYVPPVMGQITFLKQDLFTGDNWVSDDYVGNLFSGQPVYLQYDFYCDNANAAITVNNNSFVNVYHIIMLPQLRSSLINPYNSTNERLDMYYAKGVGLVYLKVIDNTGFRKRELKLRHWKVY